jgi:hypothetical protein
MFGDGDWCEWAADFVFSEDHIDGLERADATGADHFDSEPEAVVAALPRADLDDAFGFGGDAAYDASFVNCEREWLFAVDVLTCAESVDQHARVPVVRGTNQDDVAFAAVEHFAVVFEECGRAAEGGTRLFADMAVNVADSRQITVFERFLSDDGTLVTQADRSNAGTFD